MSSYFLSAWILIATTPFPRLDSAPSTHRSVGLIHVSQSPNMSALDVSSATVTFLFLTRLLFYDIILVLCLYSLKQFQLVFFIPGVYYFLFPPPFCSCAIMYWHFFYHQNCGFLRILMYILCLAHVLPCFLLLTPSCRLSLLIQIFCDRSLLCPWATCCPSSIQAGIPSPACFALSLLL